MTTPTVNTPARVQSYMDNVVSRLVKPGDAILSTLDPVGADMLHMALGLSDEIFEFLLAVSPENALEECGDAAFYLTRIAMNDNTILHMPVNAQDAHNLRMTSATFTSTHMADCSIPSGITMAALANTIIRSIKRQYIYNKEVDMEERQMATILLFGMLSITGAEITAPTEHEEGAEDGAGFVGFLEIDNPVSKEVFDANIYKTLEHNTAKLLTGENARYASGSYSDEQANARADKAGTDDQ